MIPYPSRPAIVQAIRLEVMLTYGPDANLAAGCLYWALHTADLLSRLGERVCIQAGSMQWPCMDLSRDDGVSPTHFAYMWDADSVETRSRTAQGLLPELHVWVALPDAGEIIDLTTCYFPVQAKRTCVPWTAAAPPDHLWTTFEEIPENVFYRADVQAIGWVLAAARRIGRDPQDILRMGI